MSPRGNDSVFANSVFVMALQNVTTVNNENGLWLMMIPFEDGSLALPSIDLPARDDLQLVMEATQECGTEREESKKQPGDFRVTEKLVVLIE